MEELIEEYGGALIIMLLGLALISNVLSVLFQVVTNNFIV